MRSTVLYVGIPWLCIAVTALWGFTQRACFPWNERAGAHGNLYCPGDHYVVQTISEMVARSSTTAELFCSAAALSLVGMWLALRDILRSRSPWVRDGVHACFSVGAVGYVGLTVWSLRVSGPIHTGFTAQTLSMMLLMCVMLSRTTLSRALCALQMVALVLYVSLYASIPDHDWSKGEVGYHAPANFKHAWAQYAFVTLHYLTMATLHTESTHATLQIHHNAQWGH